MKTITEPRREVPVRTECEVLVAGGGLSGVCAAIAAARAGAKTLLVEQSQILGGVATAGLMASFNNRFIAADGTQVVRGIAGEVMDRLVELGGARPDWRRPEVPHLPFDPEALQVVLIRLVREAGAQALLGTLIVRAHPHDDGIAAFIESRAGREALVAKIIVDASGEASIAALLGAECGETPAASASLEFRMGGVDLAAFFDHLRRHPEEFAEDYDVVTNFDDFARNWAERGIFHLPHGGGAVMRTVQEAIRRGEYAKERGLAHGLDAFGFYANANSDTIIINSNFYSVDSLDPRSLSAAVMDARERCFEIADFLRRFMPGFEQAYVVQTAPELGVRISRRIRGMATLTRDELESGHKFDDVVALQRRLRVTAHGEQLLEGVAEIPYGVMVPRDVERLIVASGKTVSTEPRGILRGQVNCMALGHAAGVAAALAANGGITPAQVPVSQIQRTLVSQGAYLGGDQRLRELGLR